MRSAGTREKVNNELFQTIIGYIVLKKKINNNSFNHWSVYIPSVLI